MESLYDTSNNAAVRLTPDMETDTAGRKFYRRFSAPEEEIDTYELNLVRRLQGSLEGTKRPQLQKKDKEPEKDAQEILSYAETLHNGLNIMWVPMVILGRIPFRLLLQHNHAIISVRKKSPAYLACFVTCILTWILFLWITIGFILLVTDRTASQKDKVSNYVTQQISFHLMQQYWVDTFIFWTTLLQACISTTHMLYQAEGFALFIKSWYRVLDLTKIEVSRTLKKYIIMSQVVLVTFILCVVLMYLLPDKFPFVRGTARMIVIGIAQPIIRPLKLTDETTRSKDRHFYFERLDGVGLLTYIMAILFSWMYTIQFMVFCRCFRKGLRSINQRIAMILNVDDEPRVGPNALRLTYEYIHKDYLGIATTGIKIGRIFSWTMCSYYLWSILVIVAELGEIFQFAKQDYRKSYDKRLEPLYSDAGMPVRLPPIEVITNNLMHFVITVVCIFYVSHEGSGAHAEGKQGYELARYKGLVDCTTQLERNFIRSIWVIVSDKCPVHVSPGKFFGITRSTVMTVFATSFTYFVFWVQSQGQLENAGTQDEEGVYGLKHMSLAVLADEDHPEGMDHIV